MKYNLEFVNGFFTACMLGSSQHSVDYQIMFRFMLRSRSPVSNSTNLQIWENVLNRVKLFVSRCTVAHVKSIHECVIGFIDEI